MRAILDLPNTGQGPAILISDTTNVVARHIKLEVYLDTSFNHWAMIDEIEVYSNGSKLNLNDCSNVSFDGPSKTEKYAALATCFDGEIHEFFVQTNAYIEDWSVACKWYGLHWHPQGEGDNTCPNGVGVITIDLGELYNISDIRVHVGSWASTSVGGNVQKPIGILMSYSDKNIPLSELVLDDYSRPVLAQTDADPQDDVYWVYFNPIFDKQMDEAGYTHPNLHRIVDVATDRATMAKFNEKHPRDYTLQISGVNSYRTVTYHTHDDVISENPDGTYNYPDNDEIP